MRDKEFLSLRKILHNVEIKCSAVSDAENTSKYQMLAVVTVQDEIILRYSSERGEVILKKIDWFSEKKKNIQSVDFDPSPAAWLLVLCIDNTVIDTINIFKRFK